MNDSALGSALVIPQSAFDAINAAEDKLESLKKKANEVAQGITSSFNTMAQAPNSFIGTLEQVINKLGTINDVASKIKLDNIQTSGTTKGLEKTGEAAKTTTGIITATEAEIDKLYAKFKNTQAPDFSQTQERIKQLRGEIIEAEQSVKHYSNEISKIQTKPGESGVTSSAKKSVYESQMAAEVNRIQSLKTEINLLTGNMKTQNEEWIKQRQAIIDNIESLNKYIQMIKDIKNYHIDSNSLDNQRSKDILKDMAKYYAELEKTSAQKAKKAEQDREREAKATEKAAEREAKATEKAAEREAKATEKAAEREAKATEKAAEREAKATEKKHKEQQKEYDRVFSQKNINESMTVSSALTFSQSAHSLRENLQAIKDLQQARLNLDTTDKNYKRNLQSVNAAIERHSKVLREAGVGTNALAQKTSYLTDYLSKLAQRTLAMFTINSVKDFATSIADVRGQMEMSQRSLESILQDKPKADEIFNKTVALAVKSPYRIKDLVDYTRQLSAYRIESDKLYDTTKRLADVSAGLGVDMSRLILAYGQVKAAAYLRGSEVRQFTEAGVNMYGELQDYFKEVKGEAYSTAQIVDMISKRMVKFEDVEAIFQRMTDKGGMFYNMQEIQSETLWGMIQKFHDSVDVMLNDIGKSSDGIFKKTISFATILLKHWQALASVLKTLVTLLILMGLEANKTGVSMKAAFKANFVATPMKGVGAFKLFVASLKNAGKAVKSFGIMAKEAFVSNIYVVALMALIGTITSVYHTISKYNEEQAKINEETVNLTKNTSELVNEYNRLASARRAVIQDGKKIVKDDNFDKEKEVLEKLYDDLKSKELEVPIKIGDVNLDNIDKAIAASKEKLNRFVKMAQDAKSYINNDDNSFWNNGRLPILNIPVSPDSFSEDMKDLDNATNEVLTYSSKMQTAIDALGEHYKELSRQSKKAYDSIKDGPRKGELDIEYLERANELMQRITSDGQNKNRDVLSFVRKQLYGFWGGLDNAINGTMFGSGFKGARKEAIHELQGLFDNLNGIYGNYLHTLKPAEIKTFWNQVATEKQLGELQTLILLRIVKQHYPIKIEADKDNIKDTSFTIKDQLQAELDKQHINVKVNSLLSGPLDGYVDQMDELNKGLKAYQENLDYINKHPTKKYLVGELKQRGMPDDFFSSLGPVLDTNYVDAKRVKKYIEKQISILRSLGAKTKADDNRKKKKEKEERDILQEKVNLLKEMNSEYNNQIKIKSKDQALTDVRKMYKEAAQNVGWNADDILPDDASVAKRIRKLGATAKDIAKRGGYFRIAAGIEFHIDEKEYNTLKDDISRNVDNAFSQLDLYKKLKSEGLSDEFIKNTFGDITTSFEDLKEKIDDEFNRFIKASFEKKYGKDKKKWGENIIKQYNSDIKNTANVMAQSGEDTNKAYLDKTQKLNEKVKQNTIDTFTQLIKDYKKQLSDQLQLDNWYFDERAKIMNNEKLKQNPDLQKQLLSNLKTKYNQKTSENTWNNFKGSDTYINIFSNLENVSSKAIEHMKKKLESLKEQMKDLNPSQLKEVMDVYNKMSEQLNSRNPLKALLNSLKEIKKLKRDGKTENSLIQGIADRDTENAQLEAEVSTINKIINLKQDSSKITEEDNKFIQDNNNLYTKSVPVLQDMIDKKQQTIQANKKENKTANDNLKNYSDARASLTNLISAWDTIKSKGVAAMSSINKILEATGQDSDSTTMTFVNMAGTLADLVVQAIMFQLQLNLCAVAAVSMGVAMKSAMGIIGWIVMALEAVATVLTAIFGNHDKQLQKQIEDLQKRVRKLERAYDKLKKAMDNAFDTANLLKYKDASVKALEAQRASYAAMIQAEKSKKKKDESKITEWEEKMEDIDDTIKELEENMTEALGGFGSQDNYKSAAQEFADAWVDAFNEGSDSLEALNDKFDDYFDNLLKKQIMMRASERFVEPILKKFDSIVSEGSDGANNGLDITQKELEELKALKDKNLEQMDEYVKSLMDILGVNPKASSSLSALQQGIQSVTESTAQALESILNSMRYFLARQQSDVAAIRNILEQRLGLISSQGESGGASNQMISLMQQQVGYLRQICDNWGDVMKSGHKLGGKGLKVFMN